jgi:predicted RNA-binding protein YlqC (UPF0109 family)
VSGDTFDEQLVAWIKRIILDIVRSPDLVSFKYTVDKKGSLLQVYATQEDVGRIIGKKGVAITGLRALAAAYGSSLGTKCSIKVDNLSGEPYERKNSEATA